MKTISETIRWAPFLTAVAVLAAMPAANAATYDLCAGETTITMPDGAIVPVWGYGLSGGGACNATVPGPELRNPPGDNTIVINLTNTLSVPVSVVIPGQALPRAASGGLNSQYEPVFFTDSNGRDRVRSMTAETVPGATTAYRFVNVKPGTFAYHSGTHPRVQVQMGLYGAVIADTAGNIAYPGVSYDDDVTLLYSEIDPVLHANPASASANPRDYKPKYFLINGSAYDPGSSPAAQAFSIGEPGTTTLLRFINMGLQDHFPVLQGLHATVVAEDGNPYAYAKQQYSIEISPSKTKDAIITVPDTDLIAVVDRGLNLTNAAGWDGGMLAHLAVTGGGTDDTVTMLRTRYNGGLSQTRIWARTNLGAGATLSYNGTALTYFGPTGSQPDRDYHRIFVSETNPGTVTVTSNEGGSATTSMPFSIPVQGSGDQYVATEDTLLSIAAAGVLTNDIQSPSTLNHPNAALNANLGTTTQNGTLTLAPNGSFTYLPNADFNGSDSFTYVADAVGTFQGGVPSSSPVTVFITVDPVNDNVPVAANDAYTVNANNTLTVPAAGVLANDSDADGDPLTAALQSTTTSGTLSLNANGSFTYTNTDGSQASDSFTYVANDGSANSAAATVSITIDPSAPPNIAPVANDDFASVVRKPAGVPPGDLTNNPGVTVNVALNDTDADGTINPATVSIVGLPGCATTTTPTCVVTNFGNGTIRFQPPRSRGTYLVRYQVMDNLGAVSNVATLRINVTN